MAFTPIEGYSEKRTSTVFQDGETKQRAEFNYNLSSADWTPISYDENRTTVLVQNGDIKQRATVVYNIGDSSGGETPSGLTSVTHGSTLTGNGTTTSPLDVNPTIISDINTLKSSVQTLDGDVTDLGNQVTEIQQTLNTLNTTVNGKANTSDLPQNQTGTVGQVYTKTESGGVWQSIDVYSKEETNQQIQNAIGTIETALAEV